MADALLVCESEKTLAALQRQFVQAPDVSNLADFLRISPWSAHEGRNCLRRHQVQRLITKAQTTHAPRVITINLDDSLGQKDKKTRRLEPVDWHHDHRESTKTTSRYKIAFCYLIGTIQVGDQVVTVDLCLYLRQKTVRRRNHSVTSPGGQTTELNVRSPISKNPRPTAFVAIARS